MTLKHVSLIRIAPHYARSPARSTLGLFCASAHRSRHAAPPLPPLPPHCDPTRGSATPESLCSPKEAPVHVLQASGPWIKEHRCQPPSHPHLRPSVPLSLSLSPTSSPRLRRARAVAAPSVAAISFQGLLSLFSTAVASDICLFIVAHHFARSASTPTHTATLSNTQPRHPPPVVVAAQTRA